MKITLMASLLLTTALTGCFSDSEREEIINEPVKTVEFYLKNDTARTKKITFCATDPKLELTPNCINAIRANEKIKINKMMLG